MRIFIAGAGGAIGRRLVPQLVQAGHDVVATTRSTAKLDMLAELGADSLIMDGLDPVAVGEGVAKAEPDVVVHQMTALASMGTNLRRFDRDFAVTNRLRTLGTDHLLAAASAAGVPRLIAQSYAGWPNARTGGPIKTESDELDPRPPRDQSQTLAAIGHLEAAVLAAPIDGVVLRYGSLYGPGASDLIADVVRKRRMPIIGAGSGVWSMCHVDDAASATVAAVSRGSGVYNIVDDEPAPVAEWLPFLADALGAKPPMRVPAWVGRLAGGEAAVSLMTQVRGAANAKAKRELGWYPRWATWRDGFRHGLVDRETMEPNARTE
ncbi:MAG TPA: NAD(P)-dependent oxidoreductase [Jatrophihabitans sp.]|jgi:nucleoside-diphosphate-sugar epimerase|nr:NAD(P)-dependent oxidoreductase [Jatrophihabitans sp.]